MKRKPSFLDTTSHEPAAKMRKMSATAPAHNDTDVVSKPCPLLALAGELRINIYEHVAKDAELYVKKDGRTALVCLLAYVNRQIRGELLHVLESLPPPFRTTVEGFEFEHVYAFLKVQATPAAESATVSPRRHLHIGLRINSESAEDVGSSFVKWVSRIVYGRTRGTKMRLTDRIDPSYYITQDSQAARKVFEDLREAAEMFSSLFSHCEDGTRWEQLADGLRKHLKTMPSVAEAEEEKGEEEWEDVEEET